MKSPQSKDDPNLVRMAEAVSDGAPVDWAIDRAAHGDVARQVANLQQIDEVARAYRAAHSEADAATSETPSPTQSALRTATYEPTSPQPPDASHVLFVWGPLLVLEKIGEGTYSEVYRAYDPNLKTEVALKLRRGKVAPDDPKVERFLDEARRLAMVRHEHIVTVHGADFHDGRVGLWTDLVRGETLEKRVKERGPLSANEAACIGIDLCCALSMLQAQGFLHRDIKPSNVMREHHGGKILLMDFGSAVEFTGPPSLRQQLNGTPLTTAPEVLLDGEPPSPTADIYGLGVLLYWLLSGRYPVEASGLVQLVTKLQSEESVPLVDVRPDVPRVLAQVVEQAIARDPAQRFSGPGVMQRALCAALGAIPASVIPDPRTTPEKEEAEKIRGIEAERIKEIERRRRRRVQSLSLTAAALVLFVAGYVVWRNVIPARALDAQATLFRTGNGADERLLSGAHVRVGDGLFLEIEGSERMYVYVLNTDERGAAFVMQDADPKEPLEAGMKHLLPRSDEHDRFWRVSSEGGRETILVIASRKVLPQLNRMLADWKRTSDPGSSRSNGLDAADLTIGIGDEESAKTSANGAPRSGGERPRGIGQTVQNVEPNANARADSLLPNLIQVLLADESRSKGIWFWQMHLVNDGT